MTQFFQEYNLGTKEIKKYNVAVDGKNVFDQPMTNNLIAHDKIWKIATGQGDDYAAGFLLDYDYFKNYYEFIISL